MGCDIHDYYEVRRDGRWHQLGAIFPNPWPESEDKSWPESEDRSRWISSVCDRNYRLFAILAGVRNVWGIEPITRFRGFPNDTSEQILARYTLRVVDSDPDVSKGEILRSRFETWPSGRVWTWFNDERILDPDWHSPNWLTLRELVAHDWQRLEDEETAVGPSAYQVTHAELVGPFFTAGLPALLNVAVGSEHPEGSALLQSILAGEKSALGALDDWLLERGCLSLDDVRMVFWFDS